MEERSSSFDCGVTLCSSRPCPVLYTLRPFSSGVASTRYQMASIAMFSIGRDLLCHAFHNYQGPAFLEAFENYVKSFLRKGIPSLFADVSSLYK